MFAAVVIRVTLPQFSRITESVDSVPLCTKSIIGTSVESKPETAIDLLYGAAEPDHPLASMFVEYSTVVAAPISDGVMLLPPVICLCVFD